MLKDQETEKKDHQTRWKKTNRNLLYMGKNNLQIKF